MHDERTAALRSNVSQLFITAMRNTQRDGVTLEEFAVACVDAIAVAYPVDFEKMKRRIEKTDFHQIVPRSLTINGEKKRP